MLILILILALAQSNPEGAPIDTSTISQCRCNAVDIYARDNPNNSHFGVRARNDIIVSCLATIFACTWTTIHPSVPAPNDSGWDLLKRRIITWIYALLAPEAITAWAMRQYFGARWIENYYNMHFEKEIKRPLTKRTLWGKIKHYVYEWIHGSPLPEELVDGEIRPWTITHGFFFQMGGFMRSEKGRPIATYQLIHSEMMPDIKSGKIDAPGITESEILDRSKGDILSKALVILQTTWFITQCIARWSAHLPVTELEVVTLGFAMLNALTYGFWWHKPQNIGIPVYLETKIPALVEDTPSIREGTSHADGLVEGSIPAPEALPSMTVVAGRGHNVQGESRKDHYRTKSPRRTHLTNVPGEEISLAQRSFFVRQLHEDKKHPNWQLLWRTPYTLMLAMLRSLSKLLKFTETERKKWKLRVPMFYSYSVYGDEDQTVYIVSSIIASLFGLVHFIPSWFFDFQSRPEILLWQASAGIITGQPILLGLWSKWTEGKLWFSEHKSNPLGIAVLSGIPLYIIARLILLILACLSLRHLSENSLTSIEWISFVPHL